MVERFERAVDLRPQLLYLQDLAKVKSLIESSPIARDQTPDQWYEEFRRTVRIDLQLDADRLNDINMIIQRVAENISRGTTPPNQVRLSLDNAFQDAIDPQIGRVIRGTLPNNA